MRQLAVNGGGINVVETGPKDGPAVVFVNSLGTDLRVWDEVLPRLPAGLRLIRYDKRGHGLSSLEPASRTIQAHSADLAAVLDQLQVRAALVVGLSIGGMISQTLAITRPDLVAGLVLLDTGHRIGPASNWNARIAAVREGGLAAISEAVMERWFSAAFRRDRPETVAAWRTLLERTPVGGYVAACEAVRDADLGELSPRIGIPTRVAVGSEDQATPPELVQAAAALIKG
ncbi:3-oxoadipate enol-lactonase, partial [Geminicoccus flavidas]|uniref:3-oxoadipate enol-lactonase n=1 Tax=Geminicoccus flavidas TaxID=2506407 RepID=UPI00135A2DFA